MGYFCSAFSPVSFACGALQETGCKGRAIPMDRLDNMAVRYIEERLLDPDRLEKLLGSVDWLPRP